MDSKMTYEQHKECIRAIADVMGAGETKRICPLCGGRLIVSAVGNSGSVRCENDCFKEKTVRGI